MLARATCGESGTLYAAASALHAVAVCVKGNAWCWCDLFLAQILHRRHDSAANIFHENCVDRQYAASCYNLAVLHGTERLERSSHRLATRLFDESCELGHAKGCYWAGQACFQGLGTDVELPSALGPCHTLHLRSLETLLELGCCWRAALFVSPQSISRSRALWGTVLAARLQASCDW